VVAGLLEVVWVMGLRSTDGFTRIGPSLAVGSAIVASMALLSVASRTLPPSTAYAVWGGLGVGGVVVAESVAARELPSGTRLLFLTLLLVAIVGLRLSQGPGSAQGSA
jgi:quaternary ammonium compound-resistance protein SugE